jgi:hypothetical protein
MGFKVVANPQLGLTAASLTHPVFSVHQPCSSFVFYPCFDPCLLQSSSTMGFIFGAYPPGELLGLTTAGEALLNMLRAHTAAYRAIKALPGGERHKVSYLKISNIALQSSTSNRL